MRIQSNARLASLTPLFIIIQLVIGVMGFLATADLFGGGIFATIGALIVAMFAPHIVALTAVVGAIKVWGWSWLLALTVFMWPVVLFVLSMLGIVAGTAGLGAYGAYRRKEFMKEYQRRQDEGGANADTLEGEYTIIRDGDEDGIAKD